MNEPIEPTALEVDMTADPLPKPPPLPSSPMCKYDGKTDGQILACCAEVQLLLKRIARALGVSDSTAKVDADDPAW